MRVTSIVLFLGSAAGAAVVACSSYSPSLPAAPFLCGAVDPKCPDGFACQTEANTGRMVCLAPNGMIPDSGMSGMCADDSNLEPNDTIGSAYQTTVDTDRKMLKFSGLAICPMGDKDTYAVTISTALENLEGIVTYQDSGAVLTMQILNSTGLPIVNAASVMGMADTIRVYGAMLPVGQYYVQVSGPVNGPVTTNNYELTINVTGP